MNTKKETIYPVPSSDRHGVLPASEVTYQKPETGGSWARQPGLTNERIQSSLDDLRRLANRLTKKVRALDQALEAKRAITDKEELEGAPDWTDDEALRAREQAITKLRAIEAALPDLEQSANAELIEVAPDIMRQAGYIALQILRPQLARCEETLTAVMLPFAADRKKAAKLARQSDMYRAAEWRVNKYASMCNSVTLSPSPIRTMKDIGKLEAVLKESLKPHPALQQFLGVPADAPASPDAVPAEPEGKETNSE